MGKNPVKKRMPLGRAGESSVPARTKILKHVRDLALRFGNVREDDFGFGKALAEQSITDDLTFYEKLERVQRKMPKGPVRVGKKPSRWNTFKRAAGAALKKGFDAPVQYSSK